MLWQVDPRDPQPLYEQIAEVVRRAVADQELTAGDRLPAAKELAASLDLTWLMFGVFGVGGGVG